MLKVGDVVAGRFEVVRLAGSGGMGAVYRAHDNTTASAVALKVLPLGSDADERFHREAGVLADLKHPGIVRYVDHRTDDVPVRYLAMEWLEGEDLGERLRREPLSLEESLRMGRQVAEALGAAHAQGIVHRDVKPGNLFLPGRVPARVKVLDFGIAQLSGTWNRLTRTGIAVGTPGYMAPEQARGDPDLEASCDVFGLGCVLYECIAGRGPFIAAHPMAMLGRVLFDKAEPISSLVPDIPPAVEQLVDRLLSRERDGRPRDGAEAASAIASVEGQVAAHIAAGRAPPTRAPTPSLTAREQRIVSVVVAGTTLPSSDAPTAPWTPPDHRSPAMSDLRRIAESFGARPEQLADGSLVAMLPSKSLPREQAVRAARCALAMREGWRDGPVTLVTGRAVVERVPVGDALDRAAGALAGAPLDAVRIDALTADLLDERFDVQPDGRFFRLMAERSEASTDRIAHTAERTVLGRRTPFVGRERERAMLEAAWEATKRGSGAAAILIIAAPGIGKTRLVAEWVRGVQDAARGTECLLLTARADVLGGQAPYSVFSAAIRSWADIDGRGSEEARAELEARLIGLLGETRAAEVSPVLVSIALGYRGDDPSTMDALARGDRLRAALGTWFGAVAASGPVAVILEDLHLADAPSVAMIDDGLARFAERPFLVVALARPSIDDRFDRLWSERSLTTIRLAALSLGASRALVRASVGIAPSEEEIDRLLRRGEGNPLFLEEMIRARAEGAADTLPTTVLGVLQARLDGLDAEARRVLRAASIFGDRWTAAGVSTLMGDGFSESTVADWLRHLVGCEILSERHCGSPGASFSFRHDLLRETAYAMLTDADRALGHRLAASWLEAQPELASPLVLAEHHERGGDVSGTRRWLAEAAEMALEANDFELAIAHAERAIAGGAESTELARLKLAQAEAHCWRGRYGDGSRAAVTAVSASEVGTDLWFRAVGEVAFASAPLGVRDEIVAWAVRLRDQVVGSEQEPSPTRVRALCRVCLQAVLVGAFDLARELLALAEQFGGALARADPVLAARLHQARGFVALVDGLPELALREHGHAARCFAEGSSIRHAHFSNLQEAFSLLELGRYAETQALMIEALGAGESMGLLSTLPMMRILLAYSLVRQGREHDPVIELELARVPHDPGDLRADGGTRANLALVLLARGDLAGAEREARRALAARDAFPPLGGRALGVLARVLLADGRPDHALEASREGMTALERQGSVLCDESILRLAHIEALLACGERELARGASVEARRSVEIRASHIQSEAMRESFLAIAEHAALRELECE